VTIAVLLRNLLRIVQNRVEPQPVKTEVKAISGNTEINGINGTKDHEVLDEAKPLKEAGPIL
jgi:hypothetical protein